MSASLCVVELKYDDKRKIDANYIKKGKSIAITEYMKQFLENFLEDLSTLEYSDNIEEEILYSYIDDKNIKIVNDNIDNEFKELIIQYNELNDREEKDEIIKKLSNIYALNIVIKSYYKEKLHVKEQTYISLLVI